MGILDPNDTALHAVLDEAFKPVFNNRSFKKVDMAVPLPFPSPLLYPV